MKKLLIVPLIATGLSAGFMSCEPSSDDIAKVESTAGMSNSDLEKTIKLILDTDAQLRTANLNVNADSNKKEATLSGTVESESLRSRAIDLAKGAQPDLKVNDMIEVKSHQIARQDSAEDVAKKTQEKAQQARDKVSKRVEDAWLHGKLLAKLIGNEKTSARSIDIDVNDGVVTLRGTVETAGAKAEAQRLARATEGVKRVDDQLKVSA